MKNEVILITVSPDLRMALDQNCRALQQTRTQFIRSAILRALAHYAEHDKGVLDTGKSISNRPTEWSIKKDTTK